MIYAGGPSVSELMKTNFVKKKSTTKKKRQAPEFSVFSGYIPFQSAERNFRGLSRQRAGLFVLELYPKKSRTRCVTQGPKGCRAAGWGS
jgi:hypothetical protein